jgi:phage host-nuclease inhibitor protein Gam
MTAKTPKSPPLPALQDLQETASAERRIGELLRTIRSHENDFEKQRAALDKKEDELLHPLQLEVIALAKSIFAFAQKNRAELTDNNKRKSVMLPGKTGSIAWYTTPPAVTIENVEEVLKRIKTLDLAQFIRTKEEINKEALLENEPLANTIEGVSVGQQEKFAIRPRGSKQRVECNTKTKRFKIVLPSS